MWVYAAVLVGVTAVAVIQLNRLRSHRHPEISPEALQAAADSGQAMIDDALARAAPVGEGLPVSHSSSYGWPKFEVHLGNSAALAALEESGGVETLRAAFGEAVAARGGDLGDGRVFDTNLGVVFRVDSEEQG